MDFSPSTQLYSAVALQTLALPFTLILCVISMLRERCIHHQDERRLVRLYKQHAFVFELVQFLVTLMACGFVAGNTLAAVEARSLVIGFASEDVTSRIVRSAIERNFWLVVSALCVLACMSMLDSWSLPESLQDLTDPLFRITRELVRSYIWRHDHDEEEDQIYTIKHFSYAIEQHQQNPPSALAKARTEAPPSETNHTTPAKTSTPTLPPKNFPSPAAPPTAPPTPTEMEIEPSCFPDLRELTTQAQRTPQGSPSTLTPPANAHPPASRPRYQNQTLTSALRATSKSPKARSRKRSVTFAELSDCEGSGRRERSLVRERAREIERREGKGNEECEAVMSSSVISRESEDGYSIGSEGGKGEDSMMKSDASLMESSSEVVED